MEFLLEAWEVIKVLFMFFVLPIIIFSFLSYLRLGELFNYLINEVEDVMWFVPFIIR